MLHVFITTKVKLVDNCARTNRPTPCLLLRSHIGWSEDTTRVVDHHILYSVIIKHQLTVYEEFVSDELLFVSVFVRDCALSVWSDFVRGFEKKFESWWFGEGSSRAFFSVLRRRLDWFSSDCEFLCFLNFFLQNNRETKVWASSSNVANFFFGALFAHTECKTQHWQERILPSVLCLLNFELGNRPDGLSTGNSSGQLFQDLSAEKHSLWKLRQASLILPAKTLGCEQLRSCDSSATYVRVSRCCPHC